MRVAKRWFILCVLLCLLASAVAWRIWVREAKVTHDALPIVGEGWVTNLQGIEKISHFKSTETPKTMSLTTYGDQNGFVRGDGVILFVSGRKMSSTVTTMGEQGGGGADWEPVERKEVMVQIIAQLQKLPPSVRLEPTKERKLVVHRFDKDRISAFGYDLADLPQEVLSLLWLTKIHFPAWTLRFPPDGAWQVSKNGSSGLLAITASHQLLTKADNEPLQVWDGQSHQLLRHAAGFHQTTKTVCAVNEFFLATQNGEHLSLFDQGTWERSGDTQNQDFSFFGMAKCLPDRNLFFVNSGMNPGFRDSKTLKPVPAPVGFPEFTADLASLGGGRYLVLSRAGKLSMIQAGEPYFEFKEEDVRRFCSQTSPDQHQVAVALEFGPKPRHPSVRIVQMETVTGKIVRDLSPFELPAKDYAMPCALFWSKQGDYILADLTDSQIAIWNAQSGRHRATLGMIRSESTVNNSVMSWDNSTVYQYRYDGQIHYWKLDSALRKVRAFEEELDGAAVKEVKPPQQ